MLDTGAQRLRPRNLFGPPDDFLNREVRAVGRSSPFVWTATAQSILAKVERLAPYISGTSH